MIWQEYVFLIGNLINAAFVVPMVFHPHKPPLVSSVPVALTISAFALAFLTLGQYLSFAGCAFAAAVWAILVVQEARRWLASSR